jgi:hypothetical protein
MVLERDGVRHTRGWFTQQFPEVQDMHYSFCDSVV